MDDPSFFFAPFIISWDIIFACCDFGRRVSNARSKGARSKERQEGRLGR
jgi:hypothetical protein